MCAEGVGAREWMEMGGESGELRIGWAWASADARGHVPTVWAQGRGWKWVGRRARWARASVDACIHMCGRCGGKGIDGNAWGKMSERGCADMRGQCGGKGMDGNGWGEERLWMSGRAYVRARGEWIEKTGPGGMSERGAGTCADGECAQGSGWKWVGTGPGRHELGAREWMEMGGEKSLVGMCEGGEGKGNGWKWVGAWVWA